MSANGKGRGIAGPAAARVELESLSALLRGLELVRILREDAALAAAVIEQWFDRFARQAVGPARR
ncbi:hypothetical protein [Amycolatopsis sp.]|uniref:hypothetical protein n=1 Tax=Amycolatopsis sp. TaxID=37632 RepID=UPI002D801711|nr:hypothetical protein [Amycolatopsis sp.]HET6707356.1 hypothetical protein [Amycolatopsis sp.]